MNAPMKRVMTSIRVFAFAASLLGALSAHAVQPDEILPDAALETRARNLSRELRCMVCQNQSIDDSDAPLARDLRLLVRERLKAGDSDTQIMDYLVARYGDFVLLKPRFTSHTALLWLLPFLVLIAGATALLVLRRRQQNRSSTRLSDEEEARVAEVLKRERL
jgi:cytochrome c-type biogenesis protein CcmH